MHSTSCESGLPRHRTHVPETGLDPVSCGTLNSEVNKHNMRSMQQLRTKKKTSYACLLLQALKKRPTIRTRHQVANDMYTCIDIANQQILDKVQSSIASKCRLTGSIAASLYDC